MSAIPNIEKGVPLPSGHNRTRYPFHDMEIGDSFCLPLSGEQVSVGNGTADRVAIKVRRAAGAHTKRHGAAFVVRTLKDDNIVRCWRVS